jgi:hypothetical protein
MNMFLSIKNSIKVGDHKINEGLQRYIAYIKVPLEIKVR